ncbi:hypothetical protein DNTS_021870 [Danionella cerebrum]|uniref:Periphilin-1 C-terminal domain-containing protein n=1 Tax=Danionella cerebrum TaxID=2873325 RepID=A0A553QGC1_9TELE|nr:hypothetical protein DNTS_021870 [Danionella translucida]
MGVLGCGILVLALIFQCQGSSFHSSMYRSKRFQDWSDPNDCSRTSQPFVMYSAHNFSLDIRAPGLTPKESDSYYCMAVPVPTSREAYIEWVNTTPVIADRSPEDRPLGSAWARDGHALALRQKKEVSSSSGLVSVRVSLCVTIVTSIVQLKGSEPRSGLLPSPDHFLPQCPDGTQTQKDEKKESVTRKKKEQIAEDSERNRAIRKKQEQIEEVYRKDCNTFGSVTKMLLAKDPSLEKQIQKSLLENLKDIGKRCVQAMENFIHETHHFRYSCTLQLGYT